MTARPPARATAAATVLAPAMAAIVLAGCGIQPEGAPRPIDPPHGPFQVLASRAPAATTTSGAVPEQLFLVKEGMLVAVTRYVDREPAADELVADLLEGPTDPERDAGITNALLGSRVVSEVRLMDGWAVVELAAGIEGTERTDEMLGYAQLVCTLTARPEIRGVTFTRDGQSIAVPRGDGSLSQGPLIAADYAQLLAPQ